MEEMYERRPTSSRPSPSEVTSLQTVRFDPDLNFARVDGFPHLNSLNERYTGNRAHLEDDNNGRHLRHHSRESGHSSENETFSGHRESITYAATMESYANDIYSSRDRSSFGSHRRERSLRRRLARTDYPDHSPVRSQHNESRSRSRSRRPHHNSHEHYVQRGRSTRSRSRERWLNSSHKRQRSRREKSNRNLCDNSRSHRRRDNCSSSERELYNRKHRHNRHSDSNSSQSPSVKRNSTEDFRRSRSTSTTSATGSDLPTKFVNVKKPSLTPAQSSVESNDTRVSSKENTSFINLEDESAIVSTHCTSTLPSHVTLPVADSGGDKGSSGIELSISRTNILDPRLRKRDSSLMNELLKNDIGQSQNRACLVSPGCQKDQSDLYRSGSNGEKGLSTGSKTLESKTTGPSGFQVPKPIGNLPSISDLLGDSLHETSFLPALPSPSLALADTNNVLSPSKLTNHFVIPQPLVDTVTEMAIITLEPVSSPPEDQLKLIVDNNKPSAVAVGQPKSVEEKTNAVSTPSATTDSCLSTNSISTTPEDEPNLDGKSDDKPKHSRRKKPKPEYRRPFLTGINSEERPFLHRLQSLVNQIPKNLTNKQLKQATEEGTESTPDKTNEMYETEYIFCEAHFKEFMDSYKKRSEENLPETLPDDYGEIEANNPNPEDISSTKDPERMEVDFESPTSDAILTDTLVPDSVTNTPSVTSDTVTSLLSNSVFAGSDASSALVPENSATVEGDRVTMVMDIPLQVIVPDPEVDLIPTVTSISTDCQSNEVLERMEIDQDQETVVFDVIPTTPASFLAVTHLNPADNESNTSFNFALGGSTSTSVSLTDQQECVEDERETFPMDLLPNITQKESVVAATSNSIDIPKESSSVQSIEKLGVPSESKSSVDFPTCTITTDVTDSENNVTDDMSLADSANERSSLNEAPERVSEIRIRKDIFIFKKGQKKRLQAQREEGIEALERNQKRFGNWFTQMKNTKPPKGSAEEWKTFLKRQLDIGTVKAREIVETLTHLNIMLEVDNSSGPEYSSSLSFEIMSSYFYQLFRVDEILSNFESRIRGPLLVVKYRLGRILNFYNCGEVMFANLVKKFADEKVPTFTDVCDYVRNFPLTVNHVMAVRDHQTVGVSGFEKLITALSKVKIKPKSTNQPPNTGIPNDEVSAQGNGNLKDTSAEASCITPYPDQNSVVPVVLSTPVSWSTTETTTYSTSSDSIHSPPFQIQTTRPQGYQETVRRLSQEIVHDNQDLHQRPHHIRIIHSLPIAPSQFPSNQPQGFIRPRIEQPISSFVVEFMKKNKNGSKRLYFENKDSLKRISGSGIVPKVYTYTNKSGQIVRLKLRQDQVGESLKKILTETNVESTRPPVIVSAPSLPATSSSGSYLRPPVFIGSGTNGNQPISTSNIQAISIRSQMNRSHAHPTTTNTVGGAERNQLLDNNFPIRFFNVTNGQQTIQLALPPVTQSRPMQRTGGHGNYFAQQYTIPQTQRRYVSMGMPYAYNSESGTRYVLRQRASQSTMNERMRQTQPLQYPFVPQHYLPNYQPAHSFYYTTPPHSHGSGNQSYPGSTGQFPSTRPQHE